MKQMKPEFELAKKLKGPSQLERVKAARCIINGSRASQERIEDMELWAFMSIFHPEYPPEKVRELAWDRKRKR